MLDPTNLFHVGIIVPDVEDAKERLGRTNGQTFLPSFDSEREIWTEDGKTTVHFHVSYSRDPFRLELVEEMPGTLWVAPAHGGLHHLGYWADDLERDSAMLTERGQPLAARSEFWAYHRSPYGFYTEILDARRRDEMEQRWHQMAADMR